MGNPKLFIESLANVDINNLNPKAIVEARKVLLEPDMNPEAMKCKSSAAAGLTSYLIALISEYALNHDDEVEDSQASYRVSDVREERKVGKVRQQLSSPKASKSKRVSITEKGLGSVTRHQLEELANQIQVNTNPQITWLLFSAYALTYPGKSVYAKFMKTKDSSEIAAVVHKVFNHQNITQKDSLFGRMKTFQRSTVSPLKFELARHFVGRFQRKVSTGQPLTIIYQWVLDILENIEIGDEVDTDSNASASKSPSTKRRLELSDVSLRESPGWIDSSQGSIRPATAKIDVSADFEVKEPIAELKDEFEALNKVNRKQLDELKPRYDRWYISDAAVYPVFAAYCLIHENMPFDSIWDNGRKLTMEKLNSTLR